MELAGHQDTVTGLSVSKNGHFLLSNSMDNTVRAWDLRFVIFIHSTEYPNLYIRTTLQSCLVLAYCHIRDCLVKCSKYEWDKELATFSSSFHFVYLHSGLFVRSKTVARECSGEPDTDPRRCCWGVRSLQTVPKLPPGQVTPSCASGVLILASLFTVYQDIRGASTRYLLLHLTFRMQCAIVHTELIRI